jgi:hypothetical protein
VTKPGSSRPGDPIDTVETVEWLRRRLEVRQLFIRYCDALDHQRWELLEDVFAPDVVTTWAMGTTSNGREETVGYITRHWIGLGRTHHIIGNFDVEFDDSAANATVRLRSYHSGAGSRSELFEESLCALNARAVLTPSGWRFDRFAQDIYVMLGTTDVFTMYSDPELTS